MRYRWDQMRIAGLFAGIGGLELGLRQAGHDAVMLCEVWEPAVAVLAARFPSIPRHPDIGTLKSLPRAVDAVTAGFPCQDLSQAGMTAGIDGRRSGLVDNVFRLLDRCRVPVVILENVSFMLSLNKGAAMERLASAFEERGYRWAYRTVDSLSVLPQRRKRVFFVASAGEIEPQSVLLADDAGSPNVVTRLDSHAHGFYWTEGTRGLGWAPDAVPTLKNGSTIGIPSPPAIMLPTGNIIKPDIRDAERLQGFPPDWTKGAPERLRWSLVGNAVTVPIARWLAGRLQAPGSYDRTRDRDWARKGGAFPRAARFDGARRHVAEIGDFPVWTPRPALHDFLDHPGTMLSVRATAGFLARAEASSLRFVPGFLDAVRRHLMTVQSARSQDGQAELLSGTGGSRIAPALV